MKSPFKTHWIPFKSHKITISWWPRLKRLWPGALKSSSSPSIVVHRGFHTPKARCSPATRRREEGSGGADLEGFHGAAPVLLQVLVPGNEWTFKHPPNLGIPNGRRIEWYYIYIYIMHRCKYIHQHIHCKYIYSVYNVVYRYMYIYIYACMKSWRIMYIYVYVY